MAKKRSKTIQTKSTRSTARKPRAKKAPKPQKRKRAPRKPKPVVREMVIVPVRNMVLFPGVVLPIMIGRERSVAAIRHAVEAGDPVGLLLQQDESQEHPEPRDLYSVGTTAEIVRYWTTGDDHHQAICQGQTRFKVLEFIQGEPFLVAKVELVPQDEPDTTAIEARFRVLRQRAQEVIALAPGAPEDLAQAVQAIRSPSVLSDMVATFMDAPPSDKQELLELFGLEERLDRLNQLLGELAAVLELSQKIRHDTKGTIDQAQREYYLREQLRAIRRELGDEDESGAELEELRGKLLGAGLSKEAKEMALKELRRLQRMPEQSAEHPMLRSWLEALIELPWAKRSPDSLDLARAREVLDEDHYGLEKVKRRILEFLAVRKLNPSGQGPTLCLVGPPGVGKTSLGKSVARALDREFVRVSLGGVHDEAEIRGHRRTYVGAMMGNVMTGLGKAGTRNPVFMLDEVDKLGRGIHGDPSSALLEVLDPAQNDTFQDNYLGTAFDLSEVLFLATANYLENIPGPLRDRMEVISLPGYTEEEKLEIAKRYLVHRQREAAGLTARQCKVSVAALREVIRNYTREAGVRELERSIGALYRYAATLFAGRRRKQLVVGVDEVVEILGSQKYERDAASRIRHPGVATGLAWTPVGGEILFVEAACTPGKGRLQLTGQLGDVMRESAQAAVTLVRARWEELGLEEDWYETSDLHLHLPAGAVPKDGPSAGVALFTALVSLLTGKKVKGSVAMTGEIGLRGQVLPVGGIKEKVLAAAAAGIKTVMLPARNMTDLDEVPESARKRLTFVPLEHVEEALEVAL